MSVIEITLWKMNSRICHLFALLNPSHTTGLNPKVTETWHAVKAL